MEGRVAALIWVSSMQHSYVHWQMLAIYRPLLDV